MRLPLTFSTSYPTPGPALLLSRSTENLVALPQVSVPVGVVVSAPMGLAVPLSPGLTVPFGAPPDGPPMFPT